MDKETPVRFWGGEEMSLTYNKKVPVFFTKEEEHILDGQSKICN